MKLILNGINGEYLRNVTERAAADTEYVEAAVAYASEGSLLFEWCVQHNLPLRYWGRFDDSIPVALRLLRDFLDRRSPNFTCKLLEHFHAKVIWWHGVGAYIGSANLSNAAWYNNIEAGCFFEEAELVAQATDVQLRNFFRGVDENASPLTEELFKVIEARFKELQRLAEQDRNQRKKFLATSSVKHWNGLVHQNRTAAAERNKKAFLDEWYETLQTLRDIGTRVAADENRPNWLPATVPSGAQADQFLHAHYYNHVIEDRKSKYEEAFERNHKNPERALVEAITWWRQLGAPPTNEERTLLEWAPFLREALSSDKLLGLTEEEFEEICQRVWSIQDHGRRVSNATLSLLSGERHSMAVKTKALAKYLYARRAPNSANILEAINHVLHDGAEDDLASRLWEATTPDGEWRIEHFGISAFGELVGWAMPDRFPPRNNRTSKSLRSLGFDVAVYE